MTPATLSPARSRYLSRDKSRYDRRVRSRDGSRYESREDHVTGGRDLTRACGCTRPHPHPHPVQAVDETSSLRRDLVGRPTTLEFPIAGAHAPDPGRGDR